MSNIDCTPPDYDHDKGLVIATEDVNVIINYSKNKEGICHLMTNCSIEDPGIPKRIILPH